MPGGADNLNGDLCSYITGADSRGLTTSERQRLKGPERGNPELRRSNDILRQASACFARAEPGQIMPFPENLSSEHGAGPVCHEPDIAPSACYRHQQRRQHPEHRSNRDRRDGRLIPEIQRVFAENYSVYGYRKVRQPLKREGFRVAGCTVAGPMKKLQIRGVIRGKGVRTTRSNKATGPP